MNNKQFVSLGWYCGTAASLAKYGGRSFSGPFDWGFFGLLGVLHALETDFRDFLAPEKLKPRYVEADSLIHVIDEESDMDFNHEVSSLSGYEEEMKSVRKKYQRRIKKLMETMQSSPVCFLRCVRDEKEIDYIQVKKEYIACVIKKHNASNEIVFLIPLGLSVPEDFPFPYFSLNRPCTSKSRSDLRGLFDVNVDILPYIRSHMYRAQRSKNLLRDLLYEEKIGSDIDKEKMMACLDRIYRFSREEVVNCFRYILGREPRGSQEVKACMKNFSCFEELRRSLLVSDEFLKKISVPPPYTCMVFKEGKVTPEKVRNCYRYILGREPENDQVVEFHASKYRNFADLRSAFLSSSEFRMIER